MTARLIETYTNDVFSGMPERQLAETLRQIACVDLTEAARWFYTENDQEFYLYHEYPSLLPPWPQAWFEWRVPRWSRSGDEMIDLHPELIPRLGVFASAWEHEGGDGETMLRTDGLVARAESWLHHQIEQAPEVAALRRQHIERALADGVRCRWTVIFQSFFEVEQCLNQGATAGFYLDEQGKVILGTHFMIHETDNPLLAEAEKMMLTPALFGISLLHCKNVTTEAIDVPEKVRKARAKKGLQNVQFKTLVVEPMRKQVRSATGGSSDVKQALHFVRGHFADYSEHGLFGKERLRSLYWRPLHLAGSASQGTVVKDYAVGAPEDQP